MKEEGTNFRIYPDGEVVHQDEFKVKDAVKPYPTGWVLYFIPDAILAYLQEDEDNPRCSFCKKMKK